ncbi:MAG: glycosyltransferase, partial [Bacteroidota bacterium]
GLSYERDARKLGKTKFNFRQLLGVAGDGIFGFSIKPLRIATWLGLVSAGASFIIGLFFILQRIFDFEVFGTRATDTTGFTALATGIFFMSGVILICLGILGEYLGRVYYEVKRRPNHVVAEVIEGEES